MLAFPLEHREKSIGVTKADGGLGGLEGLRSPWDCMFSTGRKKKWSKSRPNMSLSFLGIVSLSLKFPPGSQLISSQCFIRLWVVQPLKFSTLISIMPHFSENMSLFLLCSYSPSPSKGCEWSLLPMLSFPSVKSSQVSFFPQGVHIIERRLSKESFRKLKRLRN